MNGKMLYRVLAAASMLMALVPALAATPTPAGAAPGKENLYLALGDSLGEGQGATKPDQFGYVPLFYRFLKDRDVSEMRTLTNLSIGGETSGSMIANGQLDRGVAIIEGPKKVGTVTLDIGGNDLLDLLKPDGPCNPDPTTYDCRVAAYMAMQAFNENFDQILDELQAALAEKGSSPLLVMTYYNPWSGYDPNMALVVDGMLLGAGPQVECYNPELMGLNDIITCQGLAHGAIVVDVYTPFLGHGGEWTHIPQGDIHPTNAGHAAIAAAFEAAYPTP